MPDTGTTWMSMSSPSTRMICAGEAYVPTAGNPDVDETANGPSSLAEMALVTVKFVRAIGLRSPRAKREIGLHCGIAHQHVDPAWFLIGLDVVLLDVAHG